MAYTIVRKSSKTGLVLLESSVDVAEDGFVSIQSRWLAPASGLSAQAFAVDSAWPIATLPAGLPPTQGGPYLVTRSIQKQNGLTIVQATYATALNPPRLKISYNDSVNSFTGYAPPLPRTSASQGNLGIGFLEGSAVLAFDYIATTATTSYAVVEPNEFAPEPLIYNRIPRRFNVVSSGNAARVGVELVVIYTKTSEAVGKVRRHSIQSTPVLQNSASVRLGQVASGAPY